MIPRQRRLVLRGDDVVDAVELLRQRSSSKVNDVHVRGENVFVGVVHVDCVRWSGERRGQAATVEFGVVRDGDGAILTQGFQKGGVIGVFGSAVVFLKDGGVGHVMLPNQAACLVACSQVLTILAVVFEQR